MQENDLQNKRLEALLDRFKADSDRYRDMAVADDEASKRRALRALMNIRMPRPMDGETLALQDEYLARRAREKGLMFSRTYMAL